MDDQPTATSKGIKVGDALDLYFQEADLPDSIRVELRKRILDELKNLPELGGGISLGHYGLEVYEFRSVYYVDAAMFNYVMEQLRLKGVSGNWCRLGNQQEENREEGKE